MGLPKLKRTINPKSLTAVIVVTLLMVSFQNCSKGMVTSIGYGSGAVNQALQSVTSPLEVSLNQFSYMSCPQSGAQAMTPDQFAAPFYRLRFGAYNNVDNFAADYSIAPVPVTLSSIGGLGMSKAGMDYLRRTNPNPVPNAISTFIRSSPYTADSHVVAAMMLRDRSADALSRYPLAAPMLDPLNTTTMLSYISNQTQIPDGGTVKSHFFPLLGSNDRSLVGTITWGISENDEAQFRADLNNHFLAVGFTPVATAFDPTTAIQSFYSPDGDVAKRLFARGYTFDFDFSTNAINRVREWDMNPQDYTGGTVNPVDLSTQEGQDWDCFKLDIVRDHDRKAHRAKIPGGVPGSSVVIDGFTLWHDQTWIHPLKSQAWAGYLGPPRYFDNNDNNGPQSDYPEVPCDNNTANDCSSFDVLSQMHAQYASLYNMGGVVGLFKACPPEDTSYLTSVINTDLLTADRLKIVRRFLPAEYWEVNMTYGCAVPTTTAVNTGARCYASGDTEIQYFIQYYNHLSTPPGTHCGPGEHECPSVVSFCWRRK